MKKLVLTVSFLFLFSAVAWAAPLTDFSQGKASIDLNWRPNSDLEHEYISGTADGASSNFDLGLTIGLGNRFAFQWQNQTSKTKTTGLLGTSGSTVVLNATGTAKVTANQFNILYSLDKNCAVFAGYTQAKNELDGSGSFLGSAFSGTQGGKTVNGWQAGFTGSFPLGNNFVGYGTIGFGNKIENIEVGFAYQFSKNAELNLFYKSTKYKDLQYDGADWKYDMKVKGPGVGLTFKF